MRSDELTDRIRKASDIGDATAWPDFPESRLLQELTERHQQLMSNEEIRARAGYGVKEQLLTTTSGLQLYRVPDRAVGGALEKLEIQLPGQTRWTRLERVDVAGAEDYDPGPTQPGTPECYAIKDGYAELYPAPNAALPLRFTFYIRPSQIVTSQCSTLGGNGVVRGLITALNKVARTVTVNVVPFDQLLAAPAAITSANQQLDIVRPSGTFALSMYSVPQTLAGSVFTLGGTDSMDRVQVGDCVRAADQADWPTGLPEEAHRMLANRAAMQIVSDIGIDEKITTLGAIVQADLERFRENRSPQVKSAPKVIPVVPMALRGRMSRVRWLR